jgi:hypothetical protein
VNVVPGEEKGPAGLSAGDCGKRGVGNSSSYTVLFHPEKMIDSKEILNDHIIATILSPF